MSYLQSFIDDLPNKHTHIYMYIFINIYKRGLSILVMVNYQRLSPPNPAIPEVSALHLNRFEGFCSFPGRCYSLGIDEFSMENHGSGSSQNLSMGGSPVTCPHSSLQILGPMLLQAATWRLLRQTLFSGNQQALDPSSSKHFSLFLF